MRKPSHWNVWTFIHRYSGLVKSQTWVPEVQWLVPVHSPTLAQVTALQTVASKQHFSFQNFTSLSQDAFQGGWNILFGTLLSSVWKDGASLNEHLIFDEIGKWKTLLFTIVLVPMVWGSWKEGTVWENWSWDWLKTWLSREGDFSSRNIVFELWGGGWTRLGVTAPLRVRQRRESHIEWSCFPSVQSGCCLWASRLLLFL